MVRGAGVGAVGLLSAIGGCRDAQKMEPASPGPGTLARPGAETVADLAAPPEGPLTAAAWAGRMAARMDLGAVGEETGKEEGESLVVLRGDADGGGWTIRRYRVDPGERAGGEPPPELSDAKGRVTPATQDLFRTTGAGDAAIAETREYAEDVLVVFTPPLVIVPATLERGGVYRQKVEMVVHPLKNPTQVRARGTAEHEVAYEDDERVQTPMGPVVARRLRSRLHAKLGPTEVRNETTQWLVDGIGAVVEEREERTTLGGFVPLRANSERWSVTSWEGAGKAGVGGEAAVGSRSN